MLDRMGGFFFHGSLEYPGTVTLAKKNILFFKKRILFSNSKVLKSVSKIPRATPGTSACMFLKNIIY